MKPIQRRQTLLLALAVSITSAVGVIALSLMAGQPPADRRACDVALAYLTTVTPQLPRPMAIPDGPLEGLPTEQMISGAVAGLPQFKSDPDLDLNQQIARDRAARPLQRCPKVRNWIEAQGIETDLMRLSKIRCRQGRSPVLMLGLSMPIVAEDGKRAVFHSGRNHCLPISSGAWVEMRNTSDGWKLIEETPFGVP